VVVPGQVGIGLGAGSGRMRGEIFNAWWFGERGEMGGKLKARLTPLPLTFFFLGGEANERFGGRQQQEAGQRERANASHK